MTAAPLFTECSTESSAAVFAGFAKLADLVKATVRLCCHEAVYEASARWRADRRTEYQESIIYRKTISFTQTEREASGFNSVTYHPVYEEHGGSFLNRCTPQVDRRRGKYTK